MGDNVATEGAWLLKYYHDTTSGQSGAGIYKTGSSRTVYGVHTATFGCCQNQGVRINDGNADMIMNLKSDYPATPC